MAKTKNKSIWLCFAWIVHKPRVKWQIWKWFSLHSLIACVERSLKLSNEKRSEWLPDFRRRTKNNQILSQFKTYCILYKQKISRVKLPWNIVYFHGCWDSFEHLFIALFEKEKAILIMEYERFWWKVTWVKSESILVPESSVHSLDNP